jgi:hypothetical protein
MESADEHVMFKGILSQWTNVEDRRDGRWVISSISMVYVITMMEKV